MLCDPPLLSWKCHQVNQQKSKLSKVIKHTTVPFRNWLQHYNIDYCITFTESEPYCHSILFVCLSGCLSVIPRPTAYRDWSITTKFGRQVYTCLWTRVSLFGSPISHTFGAIGKNMQNFAYFQHVDSGSHQTLLVLQFVIEFANIWAQYSPSTYASTHVGFFRFVP